MESMLPSLKFEMNDLMAKYRRAKIYSKNCTHTKTKKECRARAVNFLLQFRNLRRAFQRELERISSNGPTPPEAS